MSTTVTAVPTQTPLQKLVTYALTFARLADEGARRESRGTSKGAQDAARHNRLRAGAFRFLAQDLAETCLTLEQEIEVSLRPGSENHPTAAWREAYAEVLRYAERLLRVEAV